MVAIVLLYVRLKDQPVVKGDAFLTWANILGKISSAALIVPTTEAIGQLKWNWFNNSRAMWDFEIFDKASRGPLGALMLLYRTKGRSLAALGALLILLLLAIDTFFQQVVELPDRWILQKSRGQLPLMINYIPDATMVFQDGGQNAGDDQDLAYVVDKFAFGNGTQTVPFGSGNRPDIPVSCPTSNCTWPVYETLAICSKCADISDLLDFACLNTRVDWTSDIMGGYGRESTWPNATMCGYFVNASSSNPVLMSGYIADANASTNRETLLSRVLPLVTIFERAPFYGNGSVHFKELRNTIIDALIVSAPNGSTAAVYRNETPIAHECVLTWCVKTLRSAYSWGEYDEESIDTFFNTTPGSWPWEVFPFQTEFDNGTDQYYYDSIHLQPGQTSGNSNSSWYGTSNETIIPLLGSFSDGFPSYTTARNETDEPMLRDRTYYEIPARRRRLHVNPWLDPNNFTHHMERMAAAMTNVIRSSENKIMLEGDAWNRETYILIRWAWLIFPLVLLILSLAFLVSTIVKTSKNTGIAVWKTSAMPTLIYSLPREAQTRFESSSTWNSGEHTKKVRIRLSGNKGWRVSGQGLRISSPRLPTAAARAPGGWI
ncbi:hypothetical protein NX059_008031 [Plenodomus lindquistii]|nr:hypothetical protein NX059_008031 [Plenodomus lindquistii]